VPLNNATTPIRREFAVVGVEWATTSPALSPNRQFTGFDTYEIVEVGPTSRQRMVLDLTETGSGTTSRCDSGQVPGG
jgi:hypothetical protein